MKLARKFFWISDCCECHFKVTNTFQWIKSLHNCRLHKALKGQSHLDAVMAQNRRFNLSLGRDLNETQVLKIDEAKEVNVLRIKKEDLTDFDEHLPHEFPTITFFQNLKKILRSLADRI